MVENRPIDPDDDIPNDNEKLLSENISHRFQPHKQFIYTAVVAIITMLIVFFIQGRGESVWFWAFAGLVFYVWFNSVIAFFKRVNFIGYTLLSWVLFLVLSVALLGLADLLSDLSIADMPEYRTLFSANMIFYFIATFLVAMMREVAKITGIDY